MPTLMIVFRFVHMLSLPGSFSKQFGMFDKIIFSVSDIKVYGSTIMGHFAWTVNKTMRFCVEYRNWAAYCFII